MKFVIFLGIHRSVRNKFLLAVIEKETLEASKTTLLSLCRTRWVERHEANEVFFALLPSILRALGGMSNERLFSNQFGETAWNWDTDRNARQTACYMQYPILNLSSPRSRR